MNWCIKRSSYSIEQSRTIQQCYHLILQQLETLFKSNDKGSKIVYTHTTSEVKTKFEELGCLIYQVLDLFPSSEQTRYLTLKRVFEEQYKVDHPQVVLSLDKEEISAKTVQSPDDTDCHFRNKDGNKVKGYAVTPLPRVVAMIKNLT